MNSRSDSPNLVHLVKMVQGWARTVGAYQLQHFRGGDLQVEVKSGATDLVTRVDRESERRLVALVREARPADHIVAEESSEVGVVVPAGWTWIIDPLDGTTNFAHGFPIFSISIALACDNQVLLGVVYLPYLDEMYWAIRGRGAFLGSQNLHVSSCSELKSALCATGFPYDKHCHSLNNIAYAAHIVPQLQGIRRAGSAAYDLCCVAAGHFDGYWEMALKPWDVAAGRLLVEEAGGIVIDFRADRGISLIAGGAAVANKLHQEIKKVGLG